jgi:hypothetical protein
VTQLYDSNATKHNILAILAAFDDFSNKLKPDDRVVVFMASHRSSKTDAGFRALAAQDSTLILVEAKGVFCAC